MLRTEIAYEPLEAFQRLWHLPHVVFLDSARLHPRWGRFSILTADPFLVFEGQERQSCLSSRLFTQVYESNPWEILDSTLTRFRSSPFTPSTETPEGAAIGFLGYESGCWLESMSKPKPFLAETPKMWFGFYDVLLLFDHIEKQAWLISTGIDENGSRNPSQAEFRRDQFLDELQSDVYLFPCLHSAHPSYHPVTPHDDYLSSVTKILDYLRKGDVYQVNYSQAYEGTVDEHPQNLYLRLRQSNPAPYGGYLDFGSGQILSSSPERFLRMKRRWVQTRPIKGTCPRSGILHDDWHRARELLSSPKNRAELLMITDLLRNDLGKISEFGSVTVSEFASCEEYESVFHLVSTIEAQLRPQVYHLDTLAACFPGGSVTGAPKIRAMQIIQELEPVARGPYTGALGYLGFNGISDFNILIRTLIHQEGRVHFHLGGGIVADSDPQLEYEETLHKGANLFSLWQSEEARTSYPNPKLISSIRE